MLDTSKIGPYDPKEKWRASQGIGIVRAWKLAARIGGALLGGVFVWREALSTRSFPYLALLVLQLLFAVQWAWITESELRLLSEWLDPIDYEPPTGQAQILQSMGLAIFLVGMVIATRDPLWYGIAFLGYSTVLLFAVRYFNSQLKRAIEGSRIHLAFDSSLSAASKSLYEDALKAVEEYFLGRPHTPRHIALLIIAAIGLCLAIEWELSGDKKLRLVAYGLFICNLFWSEAMIFSWRHIRDQSLDNLAQKRVLAGVRPLGRS